MEIGREFQCEIEKTVFGGDGLARVGGEVVFIPRTLPGERLIARVTACKSSFSRAEAVRFGATSPHRIEPACPYFGRCPGCRYLHAGYAYETELKAAQLADQLAQAGLEPAPGVLESPVAPEPPLGYRNKIVLHVHKVGGRTMLGYVMGDNTTVTDIEACPLAHPEINAKLAELRGDKSFLHSLHEGMDVTFRRTAAGGATYWRNQPARNATWLKEELPFGRLSVPCGSFFQVNAAGAAALADEVAALIAARKPARFIDLYAGVGFFSAVALHAGVREVLAVESEEARGGESGGDRRRRRRSPEIPERRPGFGCVADGRSAARRPDAEGRDGADRQHARFFHLQLLQSGDLGARRPAAGQRRIHPEQAPAGQYVPPDRTL